jgi:hypothetical protein
LTGVAQVFIGLLAFVAAIGVPWWQRRNEIIDRKREQARRGRGLALVLRPQLERWYGKMADVRKENPGSVAVVGARNFIGSVATKEALLPPTAIAQEVSDFYMLGWVGDELFNIVREGNEAHQMAAATQRKFFDTATSTDFDAEAVARELKRRFDLIETGVISVLDEVVELIADGGEKRMDRLYGDKPE